jgi:hypothetical protein
MDLNQYKKLLTEISLSGISIIKDSKEAGVEEQVLTVWKNAKFELMIRVYPSSKEVLSDDSEADKFVYTLASIAPESASISKRKLIHFALYEVEIEIKNILAGLWCCMWEGERDCEGLDSSLLVFFIF